MANKVDLVFGADQTRTTNQVIKDLQKIASKIEASGATKLKFSIDTKSIKNVGNVMQKSFSELKNAAKEYYGLRRQYENTGSSYTKKRLTLEKQIVDSNKRLNALYDSLKLSKKQQLEYDNLIRQQTEKELVVRSKIADVSKINGTKLAAKDEVKTYQDLLSLQTKRNLIATQLAKTDTSNKSTRAELIRQMQTAQTSYNEALSSTNAFTQKSILSAKQEESILKSQVEHRQKIKILQGQIADKEAKVLSSPIKLVSQSNIANVTTSFDKLETSISKIKDSGGVVKGLGSEFKKLVAAKSAFDKAPTRANLDAYNAQKTIVSGLADSFKVTQRETHSAENELLQYKRLLGRVEAEYNRFETNIRKDPELDARYQVLRKNLKTVSSGGSSNFKDLTDARTQVQDLGNKLEISGGKVETFTQKLKNLFGIHLTTALTMVGIHTLIQSFHQMITNVVDLDREFTQFKIVTQSTDEQLVKFGNDAAKVAEKIGSSISDIVNASVVFSRLGYSASDSLDLSKFTTVYSKVANVEMSAAESNITSIVKAFDLSTSQLESTLDKLTYVGNHFPIAASELGEGMQNAASALASSGNSFEQSLAILTAANTTLQDISKSSTAVRTITARVRNSAVELENLGETLDSSYNTVVKYRAKLKALSGVDILQSDNKTFKSTYAILDGLQKKWGSLSDTAKASITTMLAGVRQTNAFQSVMGNWNEATKVMDTMSDSTGSLQKAQETYIDSIQGRVGQFKATFQDLSTTVMDSDILKGAIIGGTDFISVLNKILSIGNGILPKATLFLVTIAALTKAQKALNLSYTNSTGRHKMICLINMPVNDLVVTRNELVA